MFCDFVTKHTDIFCCKNERSFCTANLLSQGYCTGYLVSTIKKVFGRHHDLTDSNNVSKYSQFDGLGQIIVRLPTRIPRNAMSHLLCAFTLRTQWKHQYDTCFSQIHSVVQEILFVSYSLLFLGMAGAAILDGRFVKTFNSFMPGLLWHNIGLISFRGSWELPFHVFAILFISRWPPSWIFQ